MPYYLWYELNHAALSPARAAADMTRLYFRNPLNPMTHTQMGKSLAASCELFERVTRRYGKPEFGISETRVGGVKVPVMEEVVWERPFCRLVNFKKYHPAGVAAKKQPKILMVAPMSGHYATLLRGTVETMLPTHDVYITDWIDARMVPISEGTFDLDDYIDYVINMLHVMGGNTHIMAVCQPSVPVIAAVAAMSDRDDPYTPPSMILMGGPVDTRENPTAVNILAEERGTDWFRRNVVLKVPFPHSGVMRDVYPGFLQLTGFMSMNLDRHVSAHQDFFLHLIEGDGDSAEKHAEFYDEYLAVMDLTAEFYLQTVETVFVEHALPKGEFIHRGRRVDLGKIKKTALMTVEGEKDDITGLGQTRAAHKLCTGLPDDKKVHYMQPKVGHYGVFNGSRFRSEIAPRIRDFILTHDAEVRRAQGTGKRAAATRGAELEAVKPAANGQNGTARVKAPVKSASKPAAPAVSKPAKTGQTAVETKKTASASAPKAAARARSVAKKTAATPVASKAPTKAASTTNGKTPPAPPAKRKAPTTKVAKAPAVSKSAASKSPAAKSAAPKSPVAKSAAPKPAAPKSTAAKANGSEPAKSNGKAPARKRTSGPFLSKPEGKKDDLKAIAGIGPKLEETLNGLGVFHYWQIGDWKKADIAKVDDKLQFKGRIVRDDWVKQAKALAKPAV
ncbi:MAG: polyhydroxyalkanoate depolymerase [Pseudomonadota bacterium]